MAELAPHPGAVRHGVVAEETLRLVAAVAGNEGRALLQREGQFDLGGDPLVDVHRRVVEQRRGRRRHGVKLHRREAQRIERRRRGLCARIRLADPAGGGTRGHERLLVDAAGNLPHRRDGADRRDRLQPRADLVFKFGRHEVTAVGIGAGRHRLGLHRAQARALALAHIGVEGALVLARRRIGEMRARAFQPASFKQRSRGLQREIVDALHLCVQRIVDAIDLLVEQHVGAAANRIETLVVRGLELLEHRHDGVMLAARGGRNAGLVLRRVVLNVDSHVKAPV